MTYDSEITNEVSSFCGQVKQITMAIKIRLYAVYYWLLIWYILLFNINVVEHTLHENIKNKYLWKVTGNSKLPYS